MEAVDAAAVCREVVGGFAPLAESRRVRISVEVAGPMFAWADRDRLAQIVSNYVANAVRFAPDGSSVTVAAGSAAGRVRVSVSDEGPGLATEQLDAVFERFYRVDPSRSRAHGGSGIGLAIVRALTGAMDGRAWAESAGPGRGASFYVELPTP
jgi:signal transduction histidine kinase